jgi:hypothetical protein
MGLLEDLLARGYFPKELPPGFTTKGYGTLLASSPPPASFTSTKRQAKLCKYSLARSGSFRRRLGIPNPIPHYNLCKAISDNFTDIEQVINRSVLTVSRPIPDPNKLRALVPECREGRLLEVRARRRASATYLLRADVADFYPSVYTHTLPWAAHGKSLGKSKKTDLSLYGNLLDLWVRNSQDGQTLGIPIGPDTSHVLAEMILSDVEHLLRTSLPNVKGSKFYDDFELTFSSRAEADACVSVLENAVAACELRLNVAKTKVLPLPQALDEAWSSPIRVFRFRDKPGQQRTDLTAYFNMLFEAINGGCNEVVVAYALSRLEGEDVRTVHPDNNEYVQHLISQCMVTHPASLRFGVRQLLRLREAGHALNDTVLTESLNGIVKAHAPLGHSHEVAWSLWSAMAFGVVLDTDAAKAVSTMEDAIVAILARDALHRGVVQGVNSAAWDAALNGGELYESLWLIAYEFNVRGWLPTGTADYVAADPEFGFLKSNGISFYTPFSAASSRDIIGPELHDYE